MDKQDIYETAALLLEGEIYDTSQVSVSDAALLTDILSAQRYELLVNPEFNLVYAVPAKGEQNEYI